MKKNNIHLCASLNDRYVYPLLVSIESVLINCDKQNSYIAYYILCAPEVREITLIKLQSLVYKYPLNLEIIFYNMGNNFMKVKDRMCSQATYYRLLTPIILNLRKIIYIDGDELYNGGDGTLKKPTVLACALANCCPNPPCDIASHCCFFTGSI